MTTCAKRLRVPAISLLLAACLLLPAHVTVQAGNPTGARYCAAGDSIFWFLQASDLHIGMSGTNDSARLQWLVTTAKSVINPSFIVVTGDLTDSTNGNWLGIPNGPYQAEWDQYKAIINTARGTNNWNDFFYDLPGNHDAYSDKNFLYYKANSIQGRIAGQTQASWTRAFDFGTYHFLGVNTADNTGAPFSLSWPWGDYAGLDGTELAFIGADLTAHAGDNLTFVFGHHPVTDTGVSDDTWLYYGQREFVAALDINTASAYNYGHTHRYSQALFTGNDYTGPMYHGGIHYYNVASLGKSSSSNVTLVAVDCDGVSSVSRTWGSWPFVLITTPVDRYVGGALNPYAYTVPAASNNFVRALAFDSGTISQVRFRIDGGSTWYLMSRITGGSPVWQGAWDASALAAGDHTIEVQATGSTTVSDAITVEVTGAVNLAPTATGDAYSTDYGTALSVAAPGVLGNDSDPEGRALTAALVTGPSHGALTLNANGSFTYTPGATYSGPDAFSYRAYDGALYSAAATVSMTVKAGPTTDTVTIVTATWTKRTATLKVEATSSAAPTAALTASGDGFTGRMSYSAKTKRYTYQKVMSPGPSSVTVNSSAGGSATKSVTTK
jgi:hypothetical protein